MRVTTLVGLMILFGTVYYKIGDKATNLPSIQSMVSVMFMTAAFVVRYCRGEHGCVLLSVPVVASPNVLPVRSCRALRITILPLGCAVFLHHVCLQGLLNMNTALPVLVKERPVVYRERMSYLYSPTAYAVSAIINELPWMAVICLTSVPVIYFMCGFLDSAGPFFFYLLVRHQLLSWVRTHNAVTSASAALCPPQHPNCQLYLTFIYWSLLAPVLSLCCCR